ncbi:MAG: IPT/TIG domain-containing protein [Gammaproteobacteria bacterium]
MLKLSMQAVLMMIIGLTTFGAGAAQVLPRPPEPVILSTEIDSSDRLMIISGRNFGSSHSPIVTLADEVLEVKSFSPTEIVVQVPPEMPLATYLLKVSAGGPP